MNTVEKKRTIMINKNRHKLSEKNDQQNELLIFEVKRTRNQNFR